MHEKAQKEDRERAIFFQIEMRASSSCLFAPFCGYFMNFESGSALEPKACADVLWGGGMNDGIRHGFLLH